MKHFAYSLVVVAGIAGAGMLTASDAVAGINVNEAGNSVLCKGKTCDWLKPACKKEGGKYSEGAGGTGKCNFPAVGEIGFTAKTRDMPPTKKIGE